MSPPSRPSPEAPRSPLREPSITLSDVTDELIWPRVLRAPALALSPNRLIAGCVGVFLVALILNAYDWLRGDTTPSGSAGSDPITATLTEIAEGLLGAIASLNPVRLTETVVWAATILRNSVMNNPLLTILLGLPVVTVLVLVGGTISRSTAFEFAQGRYASRDETVHFTLHRAKHFVSAVIGPVLFSTLIFLLIAIGGLLLSFPILDVIGSLLYAVGLALGALASFVLVLHVVASPMIVPALSIEGTDGFDAIQRCYAYVIGKPLRYFIYVLLLGTIATIAASIFALLASVAQDMTDWAANYFSSLATESALTGEGNLGATKSFAYNTIEAIRGIVTIIVYGYVVSLYFTSATLLYLAIRRICDGQGLTEIWEPVSDR
ncbi:MAG: hypothetical protein JJ916_07315 [Phycisphaerales bacterium]|nr:hypothetical protein [Phycisphaerales bacterium]